MLLSWKFWLLGLFGFAAGGIIAAGIFAFLAVIGVFPRLLGKTGTKKHILLYETLIVLGGTFGNVFDLYEFSIPAGQLFGQVLMAIFGVSVGIFVGCLVMSLAETLNAFPVIIRRIHLAVGLQYIVFAVAAGKFVGSMIYFWNGIGSK